VGRFDQAKIVEYAQNFTDVTGEVAVISGQLEEIRYKERTCGLPTSAPKRRSQSVTGKPSEICPL
jgi:hypothetical protein